MDSFLLSYDKVTILGPAYIIRVLFTTNVATESNFTFIKDT